MIFRNPGFRERQGVGLCKRIVVQFKLDNGFKNGTGLGPREAYGIRPVIA